MKYLFFWLNNDVAHHSLLVIAIPCMQFINTLQVNSFVKLINIKFLVCAKNCIISDHCTTLPLCSWLERTQPKLYLW